MFLPKLIYCVLKCIFFSEQYWLLVAAPQILILTTSVWQNYPLYYVNKWGEEATFRNWMKNNCGNPRTRWFLPQCLFVFIFTPMWTTGSHLPICASMQNRDLLSKVSHEIIKKSLKGCLFVCYYHILISPWLFTAFCVSFVCKTSC